MSRAYEKKYICANRLVKAAKKLEPGKLLTLRRSWGNSGQDISLSKNDSILFVGAVTLPGQPGYIVLYCLDGDRIKHFGMHAWTATFDAYFKIE